MNHALLMLVLLAVLVQTASFAAENPPATPVTPDSVSEKIHAAGVAWIDAYLKTTQPDELVPIAEAIADKLIAGGSLYVAGDPAFGDDYIRAATIYEIYADDPGRKIQDAHTQHQEETA